ncbi:hypothetical protein EW146_g9754 [Bondarzewia mesenterica]|uniref:Uncharacterized protein n=1 Tax=Bondarzewia mesenterica TaxID=1095465 RepID=A0A4S4L8K5_9AGAM|nr:hypothetical protein EW146_g9754 [Bondarzewia mesenterica]
MSYGQDLLYYISLHLRDIAYHVPPIRAGLLDQVFFLGVKAEVDAASSIIGYLKLSGRPFDILINIKAAAAWVTDFRENRHIALFGLSAFANIPNTNVGIDIYIPEWWLLGSVVEVFLLPARYAVAIRNLPPAAAAEVATTSAEMTANSANSASAATGRSRSTREERKQLWDESVVAAELAEAKLMDHMVKLEEKLARKAV